MRNSVIIKLLSILVLSAVLLSFASCQSGNEIEETTAGQGIETDENNTTESVELESEAQETEGETNLMIGEEVEYAASFTVSQVFGSNMVIQRNEYVRVWGWAEESENGKKVSATFMGKQADALIENGEWEIVFYQKHAACKELGNSLVVHNGGDVKYEFENVLIGDVFMVIGQSNVQFDINGYLEAEPDLKWTKDQLSEDSVIRMNYNTNQDNVGYPKRGTDEVCEDVVTNNGWVIPDANNIGRLSAIGYFIAYQITELTDNGIPVGISQFSANGRPLSVFMPNELAEQLGTDHFDTGMEIYVGNHHTSVETRYMYNHYINPYAKMPIAGIVWYQGEAESSKSLSRVYVERFTALMEYMRSTHNLVNRDFPVFYVEFPSVYKVEGSTQYLDTGRIRAATGMIPLSLSNSYIAVCSDLWNNETNGNNIHPYCKYEQAERVTALMDAVIYGGRSMEEAAGPVLESYELSEDRKTITLKFTNVGEGLTTSDGGTEIKGMGAVFKNNDIEEKIRITATITAPNTITVTSSKTMFGVAYNFIADNFFGEEVNLCDSDGTPAHAFWIFVEQE